MMYNVYKISCILKIMFNIVLVMCLLQEVENFKKLNVISQDEFDTLSPKVPVDPNQEVPPPPMPGESVELL